MTHTILLLFLLLGLLVELKSLLHLVQCRLLHLHWHTQVPLIYRQYVTCRSHAHHMHVTCRSHAHHTQVTQQMFTQLWTYRVSTTAQYHLRGWSVLYRCPYVSFHWCDQGSWASPSQCSHTHHRNTCQQQRMDATAGKGKLPRTITQLNHMLMYVLGHSLELIRIHVCTWYR